MYMETYKEIRRPMNNTPKNSDISLKKLDFVMWRVQRAKDGMHRKEVHRALFERPRLRPDTHH